MSNSQNVSITTPLMETMGPVLPLTSQSQNDEVQKLGADRNSSWVASLSTDQANVPNSPPEVEIDVSRSTLVETTESGQETISPANDPINNEETVNVLKSLGIVGFDVLLLGNNITQLFYLFQGNNYVWPWSLQALLLFASIILQLLILVLISCEAIFCSNQNRKISIAVDCVIFFILVLNSVIDWAPFDWLDWTL